MDDKFAAGRDFIRRESRLLERRLFATCFEGAPATGVVDAVRAFRNGDGGFGHGLEPDVRCPASLPVDVEVAFQALATARAAGRELVLGAWTICPKWRPAWRPAAPTPAVPVIESFPRAAHWTDWTYEPSLNPTAGLVGVLNRLGVAHPWLDEATAFCWAQLEAPIAERSPRTERGAVFLEQMPDDDRSAAAAARVVECLSGASSWRTDPDDPATACHR